MKGGTVDDEGRHGFDSGGLGFGDAALGCAEVDDLDIEAARIERGGDVLLGGDADGATGVEECGFGFHVDVYLVFVGLSDRPLRGAVDVAAIRMRDAKPRKRALLRGWAPFCAC